MARKNTDPDIVALKNEIAALKKQAELDKLEKKKFKAEADKIKNEIDKEKAKQKLQITQLQKKQWDEEDEIHVGTIKDFYNDCKKELWSCIIAIIAVGIVTAILF